MNICFCLCEYVCSMQYVLCILFVVGYVFISTTLLHVFDMA